MLIKECHVKEFRSSTLASEAQGFQVRGLVTSTKGFWNLMANRMQQDMESHTEAGIIHE